MSVVIDMQYREVVSGSSSVATLLSNYKLKQIWQQNTQQNTTLNKTQALMAHAPVLPQPGQYCNS